MPKSPRTYAVEPEEAVQILLDSGIRASLQVLVREASKIRTLDFLQSYWCAAAFMSNGNWCFSPVDSQPTSSDWSSSMPASRWRKEADAVKASRGPRALLEARGPKSDGWEVYLITVSDRGAVQRTHLCSVSR
jgi:hypothetical protein